MADTAAIIGLAQNGTAMTLDEFAQVEGRPGYHYELQKGVILVVDVPGVPHLLVCQAIRNALVAYQLAHPSKSMIVASGTEMALRMPEQQSERHPDLAVYLTPPPVADAQPWDYWIPEIAVEVVSKGSEDRDYRIKREEYLRAGLREYWIIDPLNRVVILLVRRADTWREMPVGEAEGIRTSLLPEFNLPLTDVFASLA